MTDPARVSIADRRRLLAIEARSMFRYYPAILDPLVEFVCGKVAEIQDEAETSARRQLLVMERIATALERLAGIPAE